MSNDLISRENVTKEISEILADALISGFRRETVSFDDVNHRIQECLKSQPTAYDVNAVVEQLEKCSSPLGMGFFPERRYISLEKAIEIVKAGGKNE